MLISILHSRKLVSIKWITALLLAFCAFEAQAQDKELNYYRCAFYDSYRAGDISSWPKLINEMEQSKTKSIEWQIEMLKAMYGLVGYQLGQHDTENAKKYVTKAEMYFDKLSVKHSNNAQIQSLLGAFCGYKMALAFYKAPYLGPKSMSHIEKSIKLDPNEPMGYIEKANSLQFRPLIFGGSKTEALKLYRKALNLAEARNNNNCDWQKMLVCAFILKTLYETNQTTEAELFKKSMLENYGKLDWIKQYVGVEYINN